MIAGRAVLAAALAATVVAGCGTQTVGPSTGEATATPSFPPRRTPGPIPTAGPFVPSQVEGLQTLTDVPYADVSCGLRDCQLPLDILAPPDGDSLPTFVLVPGGPMAFHERRYLADLAIALARRGSVVFLAAYRATPTGNAEADTLLDARCAVRYARSATADYGGNPDQVTFVGHSFGSNLVLESVTSPESDSPGCAADGNGLPDAGVAIAGFVVQVAGAETPPIPLTLIGGSDDPIVIGGAGLTDRLREIGFDAVYHEIEGAGHDEVVDPAVSPEIVDLLFAALRPSR